MVTENQLVMEYTGLPTDQSIEERLQSPTKSQRGLLRMTQQESMLDVDLENELPKEEIGQTKKTEEITQQVLIKV